MTTQEVAAQLVAYMRKGQITEAQAELYADDIICLEPEGTMTQHFTKGKAAVAEKGKQFASMIEEHHGSATSDPLVAGRYFSITMTLDATFKGRGRQLFEEVCVYEVKDGKIVQEQFIY
ncbi:MAG: nuclear transport factor 2 family protein [Bacteroidota bacterium]|nr:nuclear transport factor 2 family protein [Bacteroidota bacterium]